MEDTKALLVMVLQKIFHDRLKVVEDTYQLIYSFNNGKKEMGDYEKTLKHICDMMNDELPSEILVYLLTLVDMPHEDGHQLPIMEKIQRTYGCLAESVRPSLLEYLGRNTFKKDEEKVAGKVCSKHNESILTQNQNNETYIDKDETFKSEIKEVTNESTQYHRPSESVISPSGSTTDSSHEDAFLKPVTQRNRNKKKNNKNITLEFEEDNTSVKSLLDITASFVIRNERKLKTFYKKKLSQAWKVINSNRYCGDTLIQCYNALQDINKKVKLLRCIENDNVTEDILMEEYGQSDILLKERNMFHAVNKNPFDFMDELKLNVI